MRLVGGYYARGIGLTGPIDGPLLKGGRRMQLEKPFVVTSRGRTITVPKGFVTDFASIPRAFWRLIPPWGEYSPAAVVHDYLYRYAIVSKAEADLILLDLMRRLEVAAWKRYAIYSGLVVGGWTGWNENRLGCEWWRVRALGYQALKMVSRWSKWARFQMTLMEVTPPLAD